MHSHRLAVFLIVVNLPVVGQVEKVVIQTTGISCGVCAAISEMQFRRIPGVEDVAISRSDESITLSYTADASFDPRQIRQILPGLAVGVTQFRVSVRGRVKQEGGKWLFVAARDKFVLALT